MNKEEETENEKIKKVRRKKSKKGKKKKKTKKDSDASDEENEVSEENEDSKKEITKEKKDDSILLAGRYEYKKNMILGKGSFGEIYIAHDNDFNKKFVAVKIEYQKKTPQLKTEKNVLDMMADFEGFPEVYEYGSHQDCNFMAMELLGPSLSDLYSFCGNKFTLQTILLIAVQMVQRIQDLHNKNYLHRDIKPENFLIGIGDKSNVIYCIDFGLAKKYKDPKTMEHILYKETRMLTGTARYASINNHLGIEQSRRDDLEAIGYVLIYFFRRRLPWQGVDGSSQNAKYKKILEKKLSISVDLLCKDLPLEMSIYMNYVKNLRFDERPDYNFLKGIFTNLLFQVYSEEFIFDWYLIDHPFEAPNRKNYEAYLNHFTKRNKKSDKALSKGRTTPKVHKTEPLKHSKFIIKYEINKFDSTNNENKFPNLSNHKNINESTKFNFMDLIESKSKEIQKEEQQMKKLILNLDVDNTNKDTLKIFSPKPKASNQNLNEAKSPDNSESFSSVSSKEVKIQINEFKELKDTDIILEVKEYNERLETDKTEENENFDGDEFLQVVENFYKKNNHSKNSKKRYASNNNNSNGNSQDINFSFKNIELLVNEIPVKVKYNNNNNNNDKKISSRKIIEPVIEDPNEEIGDNTFINK